MRSDRLERCAVGRRGYREGEAPAEPEAGGHTAGNAPSDLGLGLGRSLALPNSGRHETSKRALLGALAGLALLAGGSRTRGAEAVTLKGSVVCNGACVPAPKKDEHVLVVFAIDGTAKVRAEVAKIVKDDFPEKGLDAGAAQKLMD